MKTNNLPFIFQALLAAIFFGASAPIAKLLLDDDIAPVFLAASMMRARASGATGWSLTSRSGGRLLTWKRYTIFWKSWPGKKHRQVKRTASFQR